MDNSHRPEYRQNLNLSHRSRKVTTLFLFFLALSIVWFLFADVTNCAMLKEAAMDYFVANVEAVMASAGYEQVVESPAIMREMMAAMAAGNKKRSAESADDAEGRDYKRQKLDEKGLDVDGSKEMLMSTLEEADSDAIEVE